MPPRAGPALVIVGALAVWGCLPGEPHDLGVTSEPSRADGLPLVSDQWEILEMATAHGAFTVEVKVAREVDTAELARRLVEPLQERYAEVLIYFYDRTSDTPLPMLRVQWTPRDGYVETVY